MLSNSSKVPVQKGPHRVVAVHPNGAEVIPVEKPKASPIRVALNRLQWCQSEVLEKSLQPESPRGIGNSTEHGHEEQDVDVEQEVDESMECQDDSNNAQAGSIPVKQPPRLQDHEEVDSTVWTKRRHPRAAKNSSRTN